MNDTVPQLQYLALDPLSLGIGFVAGALLIGAFLAVRLAAARQEKEGLAARLESEKAALGDYFKSLAQAALQSNTEHFLSLAGEKLKAAQAQGVNDLEKRSLEIEKMVKPVEKNLERMNSIVEQMQGTDKAIRADLLSLQRETSKLSGVLRNPSAQGRWGEFVLETILEKAHLIKGVHYDTQVQIEGGRRPDVIINLHDGFRIAIDSKAPINDFAARLDDDISHDDMVEVQAGMARAVRAHVKALGAKSYQDNVGGSDFVILFLPSEVIFSATLRSDPDIVDYAAENHVVIASPTIIISLLRVVGLSWRQVEMAKNAAEISALGADLHKRFAKFYEHFVKIGKGLNSAVASYDDAAGSMNRMVMPAARKFTKLHANNQTAPLPEIGVLERAKQTWLLTDGDMTDDDNDDDYSDGKEASHG